jgi:hypothetical protein
MEREFVAMARALETAPKGWPAALILFHLCMWRERLKNALTDVQEGRAYASPPQNVDEANDEELAGGLGVSLVDIAERSDLLLISLIKLWEELGERPFKWYANNTTTEALLGNSYVHPRNHIAEYMKENGDEAGFQSLVEEGASEMRAIAAPGHILGATLFNLAGLRVAQGRIDDALALLEEALPMRPDARLVAATDADFAPLRDNVRFKALTLD